MELLQQVSVLLVRRGEQERQKAAAARASYRQLLLNRASAPAEGDAERLLGAADLLKLTPIDLQADSLVLIELANLQLKMDAVQAEAEAQAKVIEAAKQKHEAAQLACAGRANVRPIEHAHSELSEAYGVMNGIGQRIEQLRDAAFKLKLQAPRLFAEKW